MAFLDWLKSILFGKEEKQQAKPQGIKKARRLTPTYHRLESWLSSKIKPTSDEDELKSQFDKLVRQLSKKDKRMAKALRNYIKKRAYRDSPFLLK
ncbi:MAG: hypothetical protein QXP22_00395 [Candidatus Anstonellales archaeon]